MFSTITVTKKEVVIMPKDKVEQFRISECGEELALALLFIIEKGLQDEYIEWAKKTKEELFRK